MSEADELRAARESLALQESTIGRLEEALEDLGEARDRAEVAEAAAREEAAKRDGMLQFVEKEARARRDLGAISAPSPRAITKRRLCRWRR